MCSPMPAIVINMISNTLIYTSCEKFFDISVFFVSVPFLAESINEMFQNMWHNLQIRVFTLFTRLTISQVFCSKCFPRKGVNNVKLKAGYSFYSGIFREFYVKLCPWRIWCYSFVIARYLFFKAKYWLVVIGDQ